MAADTSVAKVVQAPPLSPLPLKSRLAGTPAQPPRFGVTVKSRAGAPVTLADPRATRALVAQRAFTEWQLARLRAVERLVPVDESAAVA